MKGINFVPEEERQLTRSVLAISQDPICGNQQKGNAFWERITVHFEQSRPGGVGEQDLWNLNGKLLNTTLQNLLGFIIK